VHWRTSTYCILDSRGGLVKQATVRGSWDRLIDELRRIDQPLAIGYEASCGYGALHDRLAKLPRVQSITVAHPGHLRLIFRSKRKNDRVDAQKIALLLMLGQLPAVHVPKVDVRSWRKAIEYRQALVNRRTRTKNSLRSLLRSVGVVAPRGLWTNKGLAWLKDVELPGPLENLSRMQLLDELSQHQQHLKQVEVELNRIGRAHAGVQLLRTIPGVGPRTAEAVAGYIDDPKRFTRNKTIGSYFGIVPQQDASADVNRLGHITRQGPATVRRLITEAAWQGIRRDPTLRAYFQRLQQGRKDRRKLALIGTAHYLLRVMLAMLQSGEVWRSAV
jgi:transposase